VRCIISQKSEVLSLIVIKDGMLDEGPSNRFNEGGGGGGGGDADSPSILIRKMK
jgi:hypothetical protein